MLCVLIITIITVLLICCFVRFTNKIIDSNSDKLNTSLLIGIDSVLGVFAIVFVIGWVANILNLITIPDQIASFKIEYNNTKNLVKYYDEACIEIPDEVVLKALDLNKKIDKEVWNTKHPYYNIPKKEIAKFEKIDLEIDYWLLSEEK